MTDDQVPALTGRCMCGAVAFEVSAPLQGALYCHCNRCQRRTGSAFAVSGLTQPGSFSIVRGDDVVRAYAPGDGGWLKGFCSECGSHLFAAHPENRDLVSVRLGALDQDPGVRPGAHQFVDFAASWLPIPDDGLPRFPGRMPRD
jgi:hypothetical protein